MKERILTFTFIFLGFQFVLIFKKISNKKINQIQK